MRLVPAGRNPHEVREQYETQECGGCGGLLAYPHVFLGWLSCDCAGTRGHRSRTCRECGRVNYEPAHNPDVPRELGTGNYFNG